MKVRIILDVHREDRDVDHATGLTSAAFDRLFDALSAAGFDIEAGPDAIADYEAVR